MCKCRAPCCQWCGEFVDARECDYDYCVTGEELRLEIQELRSIISTTEILINQQKREIRELKENGTN